jgi:putative N6-adenine-specific DNA methylase
MKLVAKTLYGLEKVLAKELSDSGASAVSAVNRAVLFEGDKRLMYKANYCLRTALSILMPVADFRIRSKDDLYREGLKIKWDSFIRPGDTFSIVSVVKSPVFTHTGYPGLILKDSVADYFRNISGSRPSVNTEDPDIVINLHISNESATVSLDSSVRPLYKRGYRKEHPEAPLNEVLAAGILLNAGWDGTQDLLDPFCGSGTFPVEAGLIACRIPPGRFRSFFGFMRWKDFDPDLLEKIRIECDNLITSAGVNITGSDISTRAIQQSEINVKEAGLSDVISLRVSDFKDMRSASGKEILFMNPPYGLRLQPEETNQLYNMIGTTLKHNFPGCTAWLITPDREALKHVGLKAAQKLMLFNGALECALVKYEMYTGSRRSGGSSQNSL